MINSVRKVNQAFREHAKNYCFDNEIKRDKPQNEQICDIRMKYCDFVEDLHRDGLISDYLRDNSTYY